MGDNNMCRVVYEISCPDEPIDHAEAATVFKHATAFVGPKAKIYGEVQRGPLLSLIRVTTPFVGGYDPIYPRIRRTLCASSCSFP